MMRPPASSTLFPYTTLFRSWVLLAAGDTAGALREATAAADREDVTAKHPVTPGELLPARELEGDLLLALDRKSTRLNSSHGSISYAVFCLKKKKHTGTIERD